MSFKGKLTLLELDDLEFWRVQNYIKHYSNYIEKENQKNEDKNGNMFFAQNDTHKQARQMQKDGMKSLPNMPKNLGSMNNFKMPKI